MKLIFDKEGRKIAGACNSNYAKLRQGSLNHEQFFRATTGLLVEGMERLYGKGERFRSKRSAYIMSSSYSEDCTVSVFMETNGATEKGYDKRYRIVVGFKQGPCEAMQIGWKYGIEVHIRRYDDVHNLQECVFLLRANSGFDERVGKKWKWTGCSEREHRIRYSEQVYGDECRVYAINNLPKPSELRTCSHCQSKLSRMVCCLGIDYVKLGAIAGCMERFDIVFGESGIGLWISKKTFLAELENPGGSIMQHIATETIATET